ncbi:exocyst complex component EXO70H1-like [Impatiens glandulifera]|uniref:exocyst complex component EXO70H1-like n=1 Tax=Impatiens glandulifera TaxID=253017 RepID=UPI001FB11BCB|nr:exocyst complex component EXO70H1-like [Impatiens glandulifera]
MRTAFNSSANTTPSPSHHFHTSESSTPFSQENMEIAKLLITKWDLHGSDLCKIDSLFTGDRKEAKAFIKTVKDLQTMMNSLASDPSKSHLLISAQDLMQIAMKRLQKEFYQILTKNRAVLDPESVSNRSSSSRASTRSSLSDIEELSDEDSPVAGNSISEEEKMSENAMTDLRLIADCMNSTGYSKECLKIYKIMRKSIVDKALYHLGVENLNISQVQKMDWDAIEQHIKIWLKAVKIAVQTIFNGERFLCDTVFFSAPLIAESSFAEVCRESAMNLFIFPEHVVKYKKLSPEKIFRLLDMYDSIHNLWPEINFIFSIKSVSIVKSQCETSVTRLREAIRLMLGEFEAAIQKDMLKSVVTGGGVHPLTRYVMNYLVFLSDYSGSLTEIISDWKRSIQPPLPTTYVSSLSPTADQVSGLSVWLGWVVLMLFCKLDAKAELYKDVSLSYLFLANNINYVVSKVKASCLKLLLGDLWVVKHEEKVNQYIGNYERIGWSKVFSSIQEIKQIGCFKGFNTAFEETYRRQAEWVVPDLKLREAVKVSLARKLVPTYQEVYDKYNGGGRGEEAVVRYAPDDLRNRLLELLVGSGATGSTSAASHDRGEGSN